MSTQVKIKPRMEAEDREESVKETLRKLEKMKKELNNLYYGRNKEIEALLTGLVTNEPVLLVGAVGTAKTSMIEDLTKLIKKAKPFTYLMTRFTEPDELFGTIDLQKYKEGKLERKIENSSLKADIVFLDEIFKSSSAIRNTLLRVMNEKQYRFGDQVVDVDWLALYTASNEISYDEEDQAFLDRLVIRRFVKPVLRQNPKGLLEKGLSLKKKRKTLQPIISKEEIKDLRKQIDRMVDEFVRTRPKDMERIAQALATLSEEIEMSDRKAVKVLPVSAGISLVNGRTSITLNDVAEAIRLLAPRSEGDLEVINNVIERYKIKEVTPEEMLEEILREQEEFIDNTTRKIYGETENQLLKPLESTARNMSVVMNALSKRRIMLGETIDPLTLNLSHNPFNIDDLEGRIGKVKNTEDVVRYTVKPYEKVREYVQELDKSIRRLKEKYGAKLDHNLLFKVIGNTLAMLYATPRSYNMSLSDIERTISLPSESRVTGYMDVYGKVISPEIIRSINRTVVEGFKTLKEHVKGDNDLNELYKMMLKSTIVELTKTKYIPLLSGLNFLHSLSDYIGGLDQHDKEELVKILKENAEKIDKNNTLIDKTRDELLGLLSKNDRDKIMTFVSKIEKEFNKKLDELRG